MLVKKIKRQLGI